MENQHLCDSSSLREGSREEVIEGEPSYWALKHPGNLRAPDGRGTDAQDGARRGSRPPDGSRCHTCRPDRNNDQDSPMDDPTPGECPAPAPSHDPSATSAARRGPGHPEIPRPCTTHHHDIVRRARFDLRPLSFPRHLSTVADSPLVTRLSPPPRPLRLRVSPASPAHRK